MIQTSVTIHDAATRLGVCASTLRTWGEKTGVSGVRTSSGKRLYSEEDLAALEAVKALRDEDAGWMTIRRRIGREPVAGEAVITSATPLMPDPDAAAAPSAGAPVEPSSGLVTKVIETLNAQSGMAERYARAGYQIGRLEAEVKHLADDRERLAGRLAESEQKLCELALNEELLRAERARLGRELGEARQKLATLEINPAGPWARATAFMKKWW